MSLPELARYEVFRSPDLGEAERFVGEIFSPHRLDPRGRQWGEVRLQYAPLDALSLCFLDYGGAVDIDAESFRDFFLLQFPLRGSMEARRSGERIEARRDRPVVLSATHQWDLKWGERCASLLIRLERPEVESALARMLGQPLADPLVFDTEMSRETGAARSLWHSVRALAEDLRGTGAVISQPAARRAAEQSVIHTLLCTQPHNYSDGLRGGRSPAAPRHVTRVEAYIREHAREPLSVEDLVAVSGVSLRSLYDGFKRFRGTSPMRYLRDFRLDNVRRELERAGSEASVTQVALGWGFLQLGRFAAHYRERFGETPSETLKAARSRPH